MESFSCWIAIVFARLSTQLIYTNYLLIANYFANLVSKCLLNINSVPGTVLGLGK